MKLDHAFAGLKLMKDTSVTSTHYYPYPMARGRQADTRLDAQYPLGQEVIAVDPRGRIRIPTGLTGGIGWLDSRGTAGCLALCVMDAPGTISLLSWEGESPAVVARRRQLETEGDHESVRLLDDRYRRLLIPKDLRLTLSLSHLVHLGLPPNATSAIYVFRMSQGLELVAPSKRDEQLLAAQADFLDLP